MQTVPKPFWSVHTHSRFSAGDALPDVTALVSHAAVLGYPALGLTDHGTVSGVVQLYKAAKKYGVKPLPGVELYVTPDRTHKIQSNMHMTVVAKSEEGYRNLVRLTNMATRNFYYKPRLDLADMADLYEAGYTKGLVVGTGCWFGLVQSTLAREGVLAARQIVSTLATWFPDTYVELHNHGVTRDDEGITEDEMVDALVGIADNLGLPFFIATDAHYLSPEHQRLHDGLKKLVSFSEDPSEAMFPGGPYSLMTSKQLAKYYEPHIIARSNDYLSMLAEEACVVIPELDTFSLKVPDVSLSGDPLAELTLHITDAVAGMKPRYQERVKDELEVIATSGMAGYLLLVKAVCDQMRDQGIWFHTRGSASGSLVCWLAGITQVDPLKWGLRMDRFMSTDRTRPPDIDLDVEHSRRDEVVTWLADRFSTQQVGSHMQFSLNSDDPEVSTGSLLVKYMTSMRKQGVFTTTDWSKVPAKDQQLLKDLSGLKLISGPGTHAAGYIVAPDEAGLLQLPLSMIAGRKALVTAYGKKDVEALGFCKLDLLGLRTKTGVRMACELIYQHYLNTPAVAEAGAWQSPMDVYDSIPYNDRAVFSRIGSGKTGGIFQIEGKSFTRGCREMKPKSLNDLIAAQALFRPAMTGQKLDKLYLERRAKDAPVPQVHPDIASVTKDTFGVALYQEQIMALCRVIGMDADELTDTLDAVKASNAGTADALEYLHRIESRVDELATAREWSRPDVEWLVDGLKGYAEYSFNKAHAASYGLESYRTGWLLVNCKLEFWTGMLNAYVGQPKERDYITAARGDGVSIVSAHVNQSAANYRLQRHIGAIRRGLLSVKGVGPAAAHEIAAQAPFKTLTEMGRNVAPRKVPGAKSLALGVEPQECGGVIKALWEVDALTGLEHEQMTLQ